MVKLVECTECHECIRIEGSIEGLRETSFNVPCPYCKTSNEIQWPMAGDFTVGRCDGDENSK